jgi:hypothetical protein
MANEIRHGTEALTAIPKIWPAIAYQARYASQKIVPRVLNRTQDIAKRGDTVNLQFFPSGSVNAVGSGGSVQNQALTITQVQIVVDQWNEITVDVEDMSDLQSGVDLMEGFSKMIGLKQGEDIDSYLLGLHANFTTTPVGDTASPTPLDDDMVLSAVVTLDDAKEPDDDRTWAFAPIAKANLLKLDKFTTAEKTGLTKGLQINGMFGELYGAAVITTPLVVTSGNVRKNLYFHREGLGVAIQRNLNIEKLARVKKSLPLSGDWLYGGKVVRAATGGVVINSAK